jgi:predicted translin family RNA/ssDNA-binding protein
MSDTHDVTISGFDLDRLESELAEAREQRDKWSNLWADLSRSCVKDIAKLERELADVQQQRDRLAEALEMIATHNHEDGQCDNGYTPSHIAKQALAAVKGGTP